jgi:hypothetical protein
MADFHEPGSDHERLLKIIYFQLYEMTGYIFGFPMFPISLFEIQDIDEKSPLGRKSLTILFS